VKLSAGFEGGPAGFAFEPKNGSWLTRELTQSYSEH
jgi:hypothetical protein